MVHRPRTVLLYLVLHFPIQAVPAVTSDWMIRSFHTEDGLAYEVVRDVALSPDHTTAWMATWGGGVSGLAGSQWITLNKAMGLPSDSARAVLVEKSGALWIGTDNGIGYYDGASISAILSSNTEGLPDHKIFAIHRMRSGEIWFTTTQGYLVATRADLPAGERRSWRVIAGPEVTQGGAIRDVHEDLQGRIWLACSRTGVFSSEDGGATWIQSTSEEDASVAFHSLAETKDGAIWAVGGPFLLRFCDSRWEKLPSPTEVATCVASTPDGTLLLGTNEGLFVQDEGAWRLLILDEESPRQHVECVVPVGDGSVWVGTRQGVSRLCFPSWTTYTSTREGVPLLLDSLSVVVDSPPLALDGKGNLVGFGEAGWSPILHLTDGKGGGKAMLAPSRQGKIWLISANHAFHCNIDPPRIERRVPLPPEATSHDLYEEPEGGIWLLTQSGVYELEGDTWRPQPADPSHNRCQTYCMVKDPSGGYWVGMEDRVEYWKDGQVNQVYPAEGDLFPGLPPLQAILRAKDGRLLFSSSSTGILILAGGAWHHITSREGLHTNRVRFLHECMDGTLWVGHRDSWISCNRGGRWTTFRLSDGVPAGSVSFLGESSDGSTWACIQQAAILRYQRDTSPPNTFLQAQDTELNPGEVGYFSFGGRDAWDKTRPIDLEYSWRILAVEEKESGKGWSPYSTNTLALTPRLKPGEYVFQARAVDKDGNEDPTPASISLQVHPPLWQQPEFSFPLGILSLVALLALGIGFSKHLALRKSEERYRNLVDDALTVIIKWNARGEITFWNEFAERVFGFSKDQVMGRPAIGTIFPDEPWAREHLADITRSLLTRTSSPAQRHCENLTREGGRIRMTWTYRPILSDSGALLEVHAIGVDSTEQYRAEQALAESEEKHRTLVERATDAILIVQEGLIRYANPRLSLMFGFTPEEVLDSSIERFIPEAEQARILSNYRRRLAGEEVPGNYESVLVNRQGRRVDVELRVAVITYKGAPATLVLIHDITQRKAAQEAMLRSSRMEATATLAGGIAHDFNNLMVGVMGYTDLLRTEFQDREDVMRMLDRIARSAERAGELARQMLAYARGGKYQPRKTDLNKIIRDTVKMLSRDIPERIRLEQILAPDLPLVQADPAQMTEVVSGLLNNAVEAISGSGTIALETGVIEVSNDGQFGELVLIPGPYVHLTVSDSGSGMDPATLSRIFEPFFTTKFQGRGLGLSAVYGIVKNHGGDILVCSERGRGSIFKAFLPAK